MPDLNLIYELLKELKEENCKAHEQIIARQDVTNGRVRSLEVWRGFILGGLAIVGIVIPILIKYVL